MNDIMKIIKSLEDLNVLVEFLGALLAPLNASIVQPVISSVVKGISRRAVRRAGKEYMDKNFSLAPSFKQYLDY